MGTRSLTHVKDDVWEPGDEPRTLVTIYRQMDGYPSGMGADLAHYLNGGSITNGVAYAGATPTFNGMQELAAHLVRHLKTAQPDGGIYLYAPDSEDVGEEYVYTISNLATRTGSALNFKVEAVRGGYGDKPREMMTLYDGPPEGFDAAKAQRIYNEEDEDDTPASCVATVEYTVKVRVRTVGPIDANLLDDSVALALEDLDVTTAIRGALSRDPDLNKVVTDASVAFGSRV